MTFTLAIHVKNGIATLTHVYGTMPDGTYEISGDSYDQDKQAALAILQRDPKGQYVIHADYVRHREDQRAWPAPALIPGV